MELNSYSTICAKCAGDDPNLNGYYDDAPKATCQICDRGRKCVTIEQLADIVHDVFKKYVKPADQVVRFDPDSDHVWYEPDGQTPADIVEDILQCESRELAEEIVDYLNRSNWRSVAKGGWDYYDPTSTDFDLELPRSTKYQDEWNEFCEAAKHEGRFFNDQAAERLKDLLDPLLRGDLHQGTPPKLRVGGEADEIQYVYRARQANTNAVRSTIYANPVRELAPPPPRQRKGGRMNAVGVRAFYGCTDSDTAVAEARTPVGGTAVVGKFEFIEPVDILDLRILDEDFRTGISWLDPDLEDTVSYRDFVHELHSLIRRPVFPDDEQIDYLPTQMVAEYLGSKGFSGALFGSALLGENKERGSRRSNGLNVVLFAGASIVEGEGSLPTREITSIIEWPSVTDEGDMPEVLVTYRQRDISKTALDALLEDYPTFGDATEPTLRLREKEITSVDVTGIQYSVRKQKVVMSREHAKRQQF